MTTKGVRPKERPRTYRTFRLVDDDYFLLRDLAKGRDVPDKYTALCKLEDVLKGLEIEHAPEKKDRSPLRLGIPNKLHAAINEKANETGRTYIDILLLTARTWAKENPQRSDSE